MLGLLAAAFVSLAGCGHDEAVDEAEEGATPPLSASGLRAVWGSSAEDVWVVGADGVIFHFDGESWLPFESGTRQDLQAVHGTGPSDAWAVGDDTLLHWDGEVWTEQLPDVELFEMLLGVWCERPGKVWMSGVATDVNQGVMRFFDGGTEGRWEEEGVWEVAVANGSTSLWDVWGAGPTEIWSGGTSAGGGGFVVHGGGQAFDLVGYSGGAARAIWGTAGNDVWIAPYEGAMHHWDGVAWTPSPGVEVQNLIGVGGSARDDAWAVGLDGAIFHWDGASWESSFVETGRHLSSVWAAARDDAWIAGAEGTLLHWNGSEWEVVSEPLPE